jgi:hypothetical protein
MESPFEGGLLRRPNQYFSYESSDNDRYGVIKQQFLGIRYRSEIRKALSWGFQTDEVRSRVVRVDILFTSKFALRRRYVPMWCTEPPRFKDLVAVLRRVGWDKAAGMFIDMDALSFLSDFPDLADISFCVQDSIKMTQSNCIMCHVGDMNPYSIGGRRTLKPNGAPKDFKVHSRDTKCWNTWSGHHAVWDFEVEKGQYFHWMQTYGCVHIHTTTGHRTVRCGRRSVRLSGLDLSVLHPLLGLLRRAAKRGALYTCNILDVPCPLAEVYSQLNYHVKNVLIVYAAFLYDFRVVDGISYKDSHSIFADCTVWVESNPRLANRLGGFLSLGVLVVTEGCLNHLMANMNYPAYIPSFVYVEAEF